MIDRIVLKNIKCFSEQSFALSGLNLLTGINAAGKSTVIQGLLLAAQAGTNNAIQFRGPLVDIGDYSDLAHRDADDDSAKIEIHCRSGIHSWGYEEEHMHPHNFTVTELPSLSGEGNFAEEISTKLAYVSAERWGPRTNVPLNTYDANPFWLGKHGEYTIQFLYKLRNHLLKTPNGDPISKTHENDPRLHSTQVGTLLFNNIVAWMGEISPGVNIDANVVKDAEIGYSQFSFGTANPQNYKSTNVGFGLSYSLPIVTALMAAQPDTLVILENPEAHLHPKGQSKLGELLAATAKAGVQVIVETHSEHLINGTRIAARLGRIEPEMVNIMYISREPEAVCSRVNVLKLNEHGQLDHWPEGFFDQQAIDMKTLIRGR